MRRSAPLTSVARFMSGLFGNADLTPSDLVAALVLTAAAQHQRRRLHIKCAPVPSSSFIVGFYEEPALVLRYSVHVRSGVVWEGTDFVAWMQACAGACGRSAEQHDPQRDERQRCRYGHAYLSPDVRVFPAHTRGLLAR